MHRFMLFAFLLISSLSFAQKKDQEAALEQGPKRVLLRKAVPGMCVPAKQVIEPYGGNPDEVEPKCSVEKEELTELLNSDLQFLKNNPEFKGRGMISVIINCEGNVVGWAEAVKSRNGELNDEILAFLIKQKFEWEPGQYKGETIDAVYSFSYQDHSRETKIELNILPRKPSPSPQIPISPNRKFASLPNGKQ